MKQKAVNKDFYLKIKDNTISHKTKITRAELGNHGWALLHLIAATYPEQVSGIFIKIIPRRLHI
jgi:hypothetical protein